MLLSTTRPGAGHGDSCGSDSGKCRRLHGDEGFVHHRRNLGAARDDVYALLREHGIYSRKYFYPLTSDYACYGGMFDSSLTPVARHVAARVLTLPMYADLALEDVDRICDIVCSCTR